MTLQLAPQQQEHKDMLRDLSSAIDDNCKQARRIASLEQENQDLKTNLHEMGLELDRQKQANLRAFMAAQNGLDSDRCGEACRQIKKILGDVL